MNIQSATFTTSASSLSTCPEPDFPEFAFIGRSNVGKSSLINALANQRKNIAEVSKRPGRTQLINFFQMNKKWNLVDLPGYGYAKVSGKKKEKFNEFVSDYLLNRESLACVFCLIDSRHTPQQIDLEFTRWLLDSGIPFVLVFTKADKMKPGAVQRHMDAFLEEMSEWCTGLPRTFVTSANSQLGRKDLLNFIHQAVTSIQ
ncbi:GTP-binding protein [Rubritalea squalenifaciens DSM 18772]|uniref:Probable GTP-binding protein EngB n=1 Tax=Rubritalea squalenifaciens DSM 18772 TaxID=1123071 RepID=A0A1M6I7V7_9BACT|nr:ribosome biogenesis GTP-binding protein YihA/YsxC [Rubritalea squalenifaciens]SHJ30502.1 GTP-binding protein [Rubritalea squalenifaciens DSM 18772]